MEEVLSRLEESLDAEVFLRAGALLCGDRAALSEKVCRWAMRRFETLAASLPPPRGNFSLATLARERLNCSPEVKLLLELLLNASRSCTPLAVTLLPAEPRWLNLLFAVAFPEACLQQWMGTPSGAVEKGSILESLSLETPARMSRCLVALLSSSRWDVLLAVLTRLPASVIAAADEEFFGKLGQMLPELPEVPQAHLQDVSSAVVRVMCASPFPQRVLGVLALPVERNDIGLVRQVVLESEEARNAVPLESVLQLWSDQDVDSAQWRFLSALLAARGGCAQETAWLMVKMLMGSRGLREEGVLIAKIARSVDISIVMDFVIPIMSPANFQTLESAVLSDPAVMGRRCAAHVRLLAQRGGDAAGALLACCAVGAQLGGHSWGISWAMSTLECEYDDNLAAEVCERSPSVRAVLAGLSLDHPATLQRYWSCCPIGQEMAAAFIERFIPHHLPETSIEQFAHGLSSPQQADFARGSHLENVLATNDVLWGALAACDVNAILIPVLRPLLFRMIRRFSAVRSEAPLKLHLATLLGLLRPVSPPEFAASFPAASLVPSKSAAQLLRLYFRRLFLNDDCLGPLRIALGRHIQLTKDYFHS